MSVFEICVMLINNHGIILVIKIEYMANYLGDKNKKQVHDLHNPKDDCMMDDIMLVHKRYFIPDTFSQANSEGYANCIYCIVEPQ